VCGAPVMFELIEGLPVVEVELGVCVGVALPVKMCEVVRRPSEFVAEVRFVICAVCMKSNLRLDVLCDNLVLNLDEAFRGGEYDFLGWFVEFCRHAISG